MTNLLTGINDYIWTLFGKIIRHERSQFMLMLRYHCFCHVPRLLLQPAPELTDQQGFSFIHDSVWEVLFVFCFIFFFFDLTFAALVCGGMKKYFIQLKTGSWRGGDNSFNLNTFGSVPIKDARTLFSSLWRRHADSSANNPARGEVQALRHANILLVTASETWSQWCWWLGEGFLKTYRLQSLVESRKLARKKRLLGQQQRQ